ncbi:uncharacterized protein K02A2.6-like, partial [Camponotus floridanus]|uniref:uncharacterized protein K02A2.6-like n=1 Tax=Camponotus floridanus TaxID=104421 RepID=UPI000DC691CD
MGSLTSLCTAGDMAINWRKFKRQFLTFVNAYYEEATESRKVAILLHSAGEDAAEVFESFQLNDEDKKKLEIVLRKFNEHYLPATNVTYQRYLLFNRRQEEGEAYEHYMTALKNISLTCELRELRDSLVKDAFISGIRDKKIQEKLLNTIDIDINRALQICRTHVTVAGQVQNIKTLDDKEEASLAIKQEANIEVLKKSKGRDTGETRIDMKNKSRGNINQQKKIECKYCGYKHWYGRCPAFGKECSKCNKRNHFAKVCQAEKKRPVDTIEERNLEEDEDIEYMVEELQVSAVCDTKQSSKEWYIVSLLVKGQKVEFKCDSGAQVNVLSLKQCIQLGINPKKLVGHIPTEVTIKVDPKVAPIVLPARRIPYALRPHVKAELDRMQKMGIIEPITEPTDWVSQMVIVSKKDGDLRICLNLQPLNKAIKREHYMFPTMDEIAAKLVGAKYFCKLDAQSGFWMIPLDKNSSKLCTFQTAWGRYAFKRLPFGLNCAPEIFHRIISQTFENIEKVVSFQDDILLWASTKKELHSVLIKVLQAARAQGIKFNPKKCIFGTETISFLGHKFCHKGMSVSQEKIKAIKEIKDPTNKQSLQRALGMFNYMSKFIPNYSAICAPLRDLLKIDNEFVWTDSQRKAFQLLKKLITQAPVLGYYDPNKKLTLSVDASSIGLGATLIQEGQPIAYASRALTEVQTRYSQIEKELLAICFGVERFRQYIWGRDAVLVETDHKPLVGIFNKPLYKVPTRLQRMMLRLQPFRLTIKHVPGKYMYIADALSRDFSRTSCDSSDSQKDFDEDIEKQIAMLIENIPVTKDNWKLISQGYLEDSLLTKVKQYILKGWPTNYKEIEEKVKPFFEFKEELVVIKEIIFRGDRILIPTALKKYMLTKLHTGHPGINRMIKRAEMTMYWKGINQDIKKYVKSCKSCQKFQNGQIKQIMRYKKVPKLPWAEVGCDIFELNQKYYIVVVDSLSNFIEVVSLSDLKSATVIEKLKTIFARHGIPLILYTDGALCFDSELFKRFTKNWSFTHIMSSPHYPKSNGLAESAVKSIKKLFKKAFDAGEDPYLALLNLRNTPRDKVHSPASLLMGRNLRTNIPCSFKMLIPKITYKKDQIILEQNKMLSKYYDKTARKETKFKVGELILFQKMPKATWTPGTVQAIGSTPRSYVVQ